ncbi:MAG: hypothetical protein LBJ48_04615, partial [Coriobacteriales bacterium]|nr:hypothetical protein [Coriobacteriales bacterium]
MRGKAIPPSIRLLVLLAGLSFYWPWLMSGIFSTIVWEGSDNSGAAGLVTLMANICSLTVACLLSRRISPLLQKPVLVVLTALITAAGIALVFIAYNIIGYEALLYPGSVLTGLGAGPLILCWRECSEGLPSKTIQRGLFSFSIVLGIVLFLIVVSLPSILALSICIISPLVASLLFLYAGQEAGQGAWQESENEKYCVEKDKSRRGFMILLSCCALLSFAQGIYTTNQLLVDTQFTWTLVVSSAILLVLAIALVEFFWLRKRPHSLLARFFLPVLMLLGLTVPLLIQTDALWTRLFILIGNFLLLIFVYSEIDAAVMPGLSSKQVFGIGVIAVDIGCMAGISMGYLGKIASGGLAWVFYAMLCLVVCILHELVGMGRDDGRFGLRQGAAEFSVFVEVDATTNIDATNA